MKKPKIPEWKYIKTVNDFVIKYNKNPMAHDFYNAFKELIKKKEITERSILANLLNLQKKGILKKFKKRYYVKSNPYAEYMEKIKKWEIDLETKEILEEGVNIRILIDDLLKNITFSKGFEVRYNLDQLRDILFQTLEFGEIKLGGLRSFFEIKKA